MLAMLIGRDWCVVRFDPGCEGSGLQRRGGILGHGEASTGRETRMCRLYRAMASCLVDGAIALYSAQDASQGGHCGEASGYTFRKWKYRKGIRGK